MIAQIDAIIDPRDAVSRPRDRVDRHYRQLKSTPDPICDRFGDVFLVIDGGPACTGNPRCSKVGHRDCRGGAFVRCARSSVCVALGRDSSRSERSDRNPDRAATRRSGGF